MNIVSIKILAAIFIWCISLFGGVVAFYLRKKQQHTPHILYFAEAFAGGIFLGAALFHMLPDATAAFGKLYPHNSYPFANLICAGGFCVLLFLEQSIFYFSNLPKHAVVNPINIVPLLLTFLISIHALSEGIALGINNSIGSIVIIFVAIVAHKSSEAFAVALQLTKAQLHKIKLWTLFLLFSLMSPLGVILAIIATEATQQHTAILLTGIFNAFAAGTFLYLATLHKLHHQHDHVDQNQLLEFVATLVGLSIMAIVAIWM